VVDKDERLSNNSLSLIKSLSRRISRRPVVAVDFFHLVMLQI
jgi:hypothetical protein